MYGRQISQIRGKKGLSVAFVAKKLRVSRQTVYSWEKNESEPKLSQFIHFLLIAGFDPANFFPSFSNNNKKGKDE